MKKTYIGYHLDDDNEKCSGTQGEVMSDVHANCFTCNQPVPIDETPVFYPIDDMIHLEDMTTEEQETTPALIDWSTCFEVDNIECQDDYDDTGLYIGEHPYNTVYENQRKNDSDERETEWAY